jgi:hypothetical protein
MKRYSYFITLAAIFFAVSGLVYLVHYLIFKDPYHIFIFMGSDLGFVFLEVFLVVVVIERVLARQEKRNMLSKLNMVVGVFFSEVGTPLISKLLGCFAQRSEISQHMAISQDWSHKDFKQAMAYTLTTKAKDKLNCTNIDLNELKTFLIQKRLFLLRLLENPTVLEHELFSDLLWAVFHAVEEFEARTSLEDLPQSDLVHINGDLQRVYGYLTAEWIAYVEHLKLQYPYLFSLVIRTNPFQEQSSAIVT